MGAVGLVLILALGGGLWLQTAAGRNFALETRLRWIALVQGNRPEVLAPLFEKTLQGSLHASGIDTSLIRVERRSGSAVPARWEIPLPEGFATTRGNALATRVVQRFGGRIDDGVEEAGNRVLLTGALASGPAIEFLFMGKDKPRGGAPRLALLVDRFGYRNMAESEALIRIGRGLSVAILPHTTGARDLADRCRAGGMEVLLNLPMEGLDYPRIDPGPGAILVDMAPSEIRRRVSRSLDELGGAAGMHTFMGALAVEDADVMRAVLETAAGRNAYFVDSAPSTFSVVRETAAQVGAASIRLRTDRIDAAGVGPATVRKNLEDLAAQARERGFAVGLIRPFPATVEALTALIPLWREQGIELVPLSEIVTVPHD